MVMQRTRHVAAYNVGATQMMAPGPAANISASGTLGVNGSGTGVGTVLAIATVVLLVLYISTHGIQGSV